MPFTLRRVARVWHMNTRFIHDVAEGISGAAQAASAVDEGGGDALTIQVVIRSMNRGDYPLRLKWRIPGGDVVATSSAPSVAEAAGRTDYVTLPRSPYSVLRNRGESVGQCAMHLLPRRAVRLGHAPPDTNKCTTSQGGEGGGCSCCCCYCCCTALLYPCAPHPAPAPAAHASPSTTTSAPDAAKAMRAEDEDTLWVTDDFALALCLAGLTESLRRGLNGDAKLYAALQGDVQTQHVVVGALCADPLPTFQRLLASMSPLSVDALGRRWCARTLLTAEEANHLKWLHEEEEEDTRRARGGGEGGNVYSRATSLRALLVLSRLHATRDALAAEASHRAQGGASPHEQTPRTSPLAGPTLHEAQQVYERMQTRRADCTLCDFAALVALGAGRAEWRRATLESLTARVHACACAALREAATESDGVPLPLARLQCGVAMTFTAALLWHYSVQATELATAAATRRRTDQRNEDEAGDGEDDAARSAEAGCGRGGEVVGEVPLVEWSALVKKLRATCEAMKRHSHDVDDSKAGSASEAASAPLICAHLTALDTLLRNIDDTLHAFAAQCEATSQSSHFVDFVIWLLHEMPQSESCQRHFRRLAERSSAEALMALQKSGLLRRATETLPVMVHQLLPLLELAATEEFYGTVIHNVIAQLEDRLQRDPHGFSNDDLACLAELGTHLFADVRPSSPAAAHLASASSSGGSTREAERIAATRELMAEVSVMDGGPWALCVSTYQQLKDMVTVLLRDHRALKGQKKERRRHDDAEGTSREGGHERNADGEEEEDGAAVTRYRSHIVSESLRRRFLVFVEALVKAQLSQQTAPRSFFAALTPRHDMVANTPLFTFVSDHVTLPNIQDEYRRKLFLLVNVGRSRAERPGARAGEIFHGMRRAAQSYLTNKSNGNAQGQEDTALSAEDEIPEELRLLVGSLPLIFSPWASVMILREVLAESTGQNPRYTYVMNAAINLQLPVSATRSRIATTLNMWRFIRTQSSKLTLKESLMLRQRCIWNLPLAYILSSYWSLLTWVVIGCIVLLHIVGLDFESQIVASRLFQRFAPWAELMPRLEPWQYSAAAALAADYFDDNHAAGTGKADTGKADTPESAWEEGDLGNVMTGPLRRNEDELVAAPETRTRQGRVVANHHPEQPHVALTSYLLSGDDGRHRPMTVICFCSGSGSDGDATRRAAEECGNVFAVLQELAVRLPFPFFVDVPHTMPVEGVVAQIAHRIRRISLESTWFLPRSLIRMFPIENHRPERALVSHTCSQANLLQRRITFLLYVHESGLVTGDWIRGLQQSLLAEHANLVVLVHESSLRKGGVTPDALAALAKSSTSGGSGGGGGVAVHSALRVLAFSRPLFPSPHRYEQQQQKLLRPVAPPQSMNAATTIKTTEVQAQQPSLWLRLWRWLLRVMYGINSHDKDRSAAAMMKVAGVQQQQQPSESVAAESRVTLSGFARRFGTMHADYRTYSPAIVQLVAGASGFTTDRLAPHICAWYEQTREAMARAAECVYT